MKHIAPSTKAIEILMLRFGYDPAGPAWFPINSPEMLIAALDAYASEYNLWGLGLDHSQPLQSLIDAAFHDNADMREARLFIVRYRARTYVVRQIRTVSVRITYTMQAIGMSKLSSFSSKLRLKEYRVRNGMLVSRKHSFTSASETMRLNESDTETLLRLLWEELRKRVERHHLQPPYLIPVTEHESQTVLMKDKADPLIAVPGTNSSDKFPSVPTHNSIKRYLWYMPKKYFEFAGYQEPRKQSIHLWDNAHDTTYD